VSSSSRTAWWIAVGCVTNLMYGAGGAATAHAGVPAVAAAMRAERPALIDIQVQSPCPFVVRVTYGRDYRGNGRLVGRGWREYLWMPGCVREVARDGPYIYADF
jgi:hypothetical protein